MSVRVIGFKLLILIVLSSILITFQIFTFWVVPLHCIAQFVICSNGARFNNIGTLKRDPCGAKKLPYILAYKSLSRISRPPKMRVPMWSKIVDPRISRRCAFPSLSSVHRTHPSHALCWNGSTPQSPATVVCGRRGLRIRRSVYHTIGARRPSPIVR